jgi:enoyl-CoA hydratase
MTAPSLLSKKDGPIGWMIFSNPDRRNAVTQEMWATVPEVLNDFAADPAIQVVVVRGAGEQTFISGADISQFEAKRTAPADQERYNAIFGKANAALAEMAKPTLAMIRGYCIGGGLGIAVGCDLRIATDDARFGIPAALLGVGYAYTGVKRLVDLVGPSFAKEIFYTGRQFDAGEALTMGLVNRVVPAAELETYTRECATRIAGNSPLTIKAAKLCVETALAEGSKKDLQAANRAVEACNLSEDYKEGRRAFLEKRRPQFKGR